MPVFEYECGQCGKVTEVLVRGSGKVRAKCSHCGSTDLNKRFSTFAVGQGRPESPSCSDGSCGLTGSGGCSTGNCPMG